MKTLVCHCVHLLLTGWTDSASEIIQGMDPDFISDLGLAERRDPDALPPRNFFESLMNFLYNAFQGLSKGNALFALKAAMLTGMSLRHSGHELD